ncbi:hypothetical protein [Mucisphaera calidilacus]|uniref:Dockerin domain-containing protein n=1 Tax=Mucisphaera calidilacus TaxID=2527982 RepID=A0A518BUA0_9BACT|nr:hypothetical protein [Mucisphaera calidilacus]QDU70558.1 hypothetical protein Pan265_03860 [Mucisphaera calidilacus]
MFEARLVVCGVSTRALLAAFVAGSLVSPTRADDLLLDTDLLTITNLTTNQVWGAGEGLVGASDQNGVATFTFSDDFMLGAGDTLTGAGSAPARFLVGNNVLIDTGAVIDFSAIGTQAGPGGGVGGVGGTGGGGSVGGGGGDGAGVQPIVGGGAFAFFFGFNPPPVPSFGGKDGQVGFAADVADGGVDGTAGSAGFGQLSGGGLGGLAGQAGGVGSLQGGGGSGGVGGTPGISLPFEFITGPLTNNALKPGDGTVGLSGTGGDDGDAGGTGRGGQNLSGAFGLTGGAGGGGGGGAGGAQGGGGGGGGGGGASGAGAWAIVAVPDATKPGWSFGGTGGIGGRGGDGGAGGTGGFGADGRDGGAGGGAFAIEAQGEIVYRGSGLATGGDGASGVAGASGAAGGGGQGGGFFQDGTIGLPGVQTYSIPFTPIFFIGPNFPGQTGADGAIGGAGGAGGDGGRGGHAGGGSGGTIKLVGTRVSGQGATVDLSGGLGGDSSTSIDDGGRGRFLLGTNAVAEGSSAIGTFGGGVAGQDSPTRLGSRSANPFIAGAPLVPNLPNLVGGAEAFGLTGLDATQIETSPGVTLVSQTPANALGGIARYDLDLEGFSAFIGYDLLVLYSARPETLENPRFGVGQEGFGERLLLGGAGNDPLFGGTSDQVLSGLESFGVYATLIPEDAEDFFFSFETAGNVYSAQQQVLTPGEFIYVTASPDNPVYDAVWSSSGSGVWSDPLRWVVTDAETGQAPGPGELVGWPGYPQNVLGGYAFNVEVGRDATPVFAQVAQDVSVAIDQLRVANLSSVTIQPGRSLTIEQFVERSGSGLITNDGTIYLNSGVGNDGTLRFTGPDIVLEGSGLLASYGGGLTSLQGLRATDRLTQRAGHTISIDGALGNNALLIVNEGTITNAPLAAGAVLGALVIDPTGDAQRNTPGLDNAGAILGVAPLTIRDTFLLNRAGGTISGGTVNLESVRLHNDGSFTATNLNISNSVGMLGGSGSFDVTNLAVTNSELALTTPIWTSDRLEVFSSVIVNDASIGSAKGILITDTTLLGGVLRIGADASVDGRFENVTIVGDGQPGGGGVAQLSTSDLEVAGRLRVEGLDTVEFNTLYIDESAEVVFSSTGGGSTYASIYELGGTPDGSGDASVLIRMLGDSDELELYDIRSDDLRARIEATYVYLGGGEINPSGSSDDVEAGFTLIGAFEGDAILSDGTFDFRQAQGNAFDLTVIESTIRGGDITVDGLFDMSSSTVENARLNLVSDAYLDGTLRNVTLGPSTYAQLGELVIDGVLEIEDNGYTAFEGGTIIINNDLNFRGSTFIEFYDVTLFADNPGSRVTFGAGVTVEIGSGLDAGTLGEDSIIFENEGSLSWLDAGTIDAFGGGPGGAVGLINRGSIEGTVGLSDGQPDIRDTVIDNEGGYLSAVLEWVEVRGGVVGSIEATDVTLVDVTVRNGTVFSIDGTLELVGEIVLDQGSISATGGFGPLRLGPGGVVISGTGSVDLSDGVEALNSGDRLVLGENVSSTFDFDSSGYLLSDTGAAITNLGSMEVFGSLEISGISGLVTLPAGSSVPNEADPVYAELGNIQPGEEGSFTGSLDNAFVTLESDTVYATDFAFINRGSVFASYTQVSGEAFDNRGGYFEGDTLELYDAVILGGSLDGEGPVGYLGFGEVYLEDGQIRGGEVDGDVYAWSGFNILEDVTLFSTLYMDAGDDTLTLAGRTVISQVAPMSGIIEIAANADVSIDDFDTSYYDSRTELEIHVTHADSQLSFRTFSSLVHTLVHTGGRINIGSIDIADDESPLTYLQEGGVVSPGGRPGDSVNSFAGSFFLTYGYTYEMLEEAVLLIEVNELPFQPYDRFLTDDTATLILNGSLAIELVGGRPAAGTEFQILNIDPGASVTGWFDTSGIDTSLWDLSDLATLGIIRALALTGDFDGDGVLAASDLELLYQAIGSGDPVFDLDEDAAVDGQDLALWLTGLFGTASGDANLDGRVDLLDLSVLAGGFNGVATSYQGGDFNADGFVDLLDLSVLASTFGFDNTVIPEPGGLAVLLAGGWVLRRGGRRVA